MFYLIKTILSILSMGTLFLLPMHKAASEAHSDAPKSMLVNWVDVNAKITALALEQQKTASMISRLQISLNAASKELNALKAKQYNNVEAVYVSARRTANGHGR